MDEFIGCTKFKYDENNNKPVSEPKSNNTN